MANQVGETGFGLEVRNPHEDVLEGSLSNVCVPARRPWRAGVKGRAPALVSGETLHPTCRRSWGTHALPKPFPRVLEPSAFANPLSKWLEVLWATVGEMASERPLELKSQSWATAIRIKVINEADQSATRKGSRVRVEDPRVEPPGSPMEQRESPARQPETEPWARAAGDPGTLCQEKRQLPPWCRPYPLGLCRSLASLKAGPSPASSKESS